MGNTIYPFANITGGTDDSYLDYFNGDSLADGDFAIGIVGGERYSYQLVSSSGATENSPFRIAPDTNPGTKIWHLVDTSARIGSLVHLSNDELIDDTFLTPISWDEAEYDVGGFWDIADADTFTIPIGVTRVKLNANLEVQANATGYIEAYIKNNNGYHYGLPNIRRLPVDSSNDARICISSSNVVVSSGDELKLNVYHTSGASLYLRDSVKTWFSIEAVGFG